MAKKSFLAAPRMCIDCMLKPAHLRRAAKLAGQENLLNTPVVMGTHLDRQPLAIALITGKKWQNGRSLRVAFLDGNTAQQSLVKQVMPEWQQYANITFQFISDPGQAEIRVSFSLPGAWSYIGTDALGLPRNQPSMNFGFIDRATVLHETGHCLGAIHEHQHPEANIPWNVAKVYAYFGGPPNNWSKQQVDTNLFERYGKDITQFSAYDKTSIMHYPVDPALTDGRYAVGWNRELSANDKSFMADMYPKPSAPPVVPTPSLPASGTYKVTNLDGKTAIILD